MIRGFDDVKLGYMVVQPYGMFFFYKLPNGGTPSNESKCSPKDDWTVCLIHPPGKPLAPPTEVYNWGDLWLVDGVMFDAYNQGVLDGRGTTNLG